MRVIQCQGCASKAQHRSRPATAEEPGETVRRVVGRSIGAVFCDSCNMPIMPGEEATAWSAWRNDQRPMPAWEGEYLRSAYEVPS